MKSVSTSPHGTNRARTTLRLLQHRIVSGEWPLNSKIPTEKELVTELGVGRSTVREAVRTLANMGMLEPAPSRGTFVRSLTPVSEVLGEFVAGRGAAELLEARIALEVEVARLAAARATPEALEGLRGTHDADLAGTTLRGAVPGRFHALLVKAADSALLAELLTGVVSGLRRAGDRGEVEVGLDVAAMHADHAAILAAVRAGDVEAAGEAARRHATRDLLLSV